MMRFRLSVLSSNTAWLACPDVVMVFGPLVKVVFARPVSWLLSCMPVVIPSQTFR